jgi:group I intron endonuclease
MGVVYLIENNTNGKKYVGITTRGASFRFKTHCKSAENGSTFRIHAAIRKYGPDNFTVTVLEHAEKRSELYSLERKWISHYDSMNYSLGYNMTSGGDGAAGRDVSEESRMKMSRKVKKHRESIGFDGRKLLTSAANAAKRGNKESEISRSRKSIAQKTRFAKMTDEERKEHGKKSASSISEDGRVRQLAALQTSVSPRRIKGYKQQLTVCPHCHKIGGDSAMKRYHFDNCKMRK